ncbi:MAG: chorismate mutase [Acidobacteriota bacterium]|nr:chorismate mutase [Acidobacteriota bacterium]
MGSINEKTEAELDALRFRIDELDRMLVEVLSERAYCALEIGKVKRSSGLAVHQPGREERVVQHAKSINEGPFDCEALERLFRRIIDETRGLERADDDRPVDPKKGKGSER